MKKYCPSVYILPLPTVLITLKVDNQFVCAACNFCGVLCLHPAHVYISVAHESLIYDRVSSASTIGLHIPSTGLLEQPDFKSVIVKLLDGHSSSGQLISELKCDALLSGCMISLECTIETKHNFEDRTMFVLRVGQTFVEQKRLLEGKRNPYMDMVDPIISFPDRTFRATGVLVDDAFSVGYGYGGLMGQGKHILRKGIKRSILRLYGQIQKCGVEEEGSSENKIAVGPRAMIYPLPVALIGTVWQGQTNFSVVANCGMLSFSGLFCISSVKSHCTNKGIHENGCFSINLPSASSIKKADYCGIVSGNQHSKEGVFKCSQGEFREAPLIDECPVSMECGLVAHFSLGMMDVFIGKVQGTFLEPCHTDTENFYRNVATELLLYALNRQYWKIGRLL